MPSDPLASSDTALPPCTDAYPSLCVLASGSRGNCSVIRVPSPDAPGVDGDRLILIDTGITPRRTSALLADLGLSLDRVDAALYTHLDTDHFQPSWTSALPAHARVYVHRRHRGRAEVVGLLHRRAVLFEEVFEIPLSLHLPASHFRNERPALRVFPHLMHHDGLGAVAFRLRAANAADLGFATDAGRVTDALVGHLAGVGSLALESNYCPELQKASNRPAFLKRRIMGGSGHLSNQQSADAARRIAPRDHLVLLHLSMQCNRPDLALAPHTGARYRVVVSSQDAPTPWISFGPPPAVEPDAMPRGVAFGSRQATLFAGV